jgi:hypothetical protein
MDPFEEFLRLANDNDHDAILGDLDTECIGNACRVPELGYGPDLWI